MLKDTLTQMKAASAGKTPPEALEIMLRSRETLTNSDILDRVIRVGDNAPDFTLADEAGKRIELTDLRAKGAVVISIYRGVW